MDWDKLKIFHTVAEATSFTKASTILNLSQSAISRQIQALESDLKVKGSLMHPQVFGQFSVAGIQVKGDVTPVDVKDGRIDLDFDGYSAKLDANVETPDGHLDIEGSGDWQDLQAWRSKVRIFADELMVDVPPMAAE